MNLRRILSLSLASAVLAGPVEISRGQAPQAPLAASPSAPMVREIDVQYAGPATITKEKVLANMRTRVGKAYDDKVVEEDIRNLYGTGAVTNVRIFGERAADGGVKVIVVIMAKASVSEVIINGPEKVKPGRIRKEVTVKPGDPLNESVIEADRQKLLTYYQERGFGEVDIQYVIEADEAKGTARVTFNINEGGKLFIRSVKFEGNANVPSVEIKKVIKSKPKFFLDFLSKGGKVNMDQLRDDQNAIKDLLQSRGFVDADVADAELQRNEGKVDIVWRINEGPQYKVGGVKFEGVQLLPMDKLERVLRTKNGATYAPQNVRADIKAMEDLYGALGYVDLRVGAAVTPAQNHVVDVDFKLEEGVQSYVEHVNITGNERTKDKVLRREVLVAPGDVFNTVRVDASKQRLLNLNYFSKVDVYPSDTLVPGRKDLNIIVEEKRTGSFNFGAGFSSIDSLIGFAEVTQGNFDVTRWPYFTGGGQKFRLRMQYGLRRKDFIIALTEPYFLDYKISVGGELFYRDASFVSDVYDERRYGIALNARKALTDFTYLRFGYRLENIGIHNVDESVTEEIRKEEGDKLKSELTLGVTYDSRDSVFLTRKGERISFDAFVAGGPLGGDIQTYGFSLEASKYILLPYDTILTLNGEVATVQDWGGGEGGVPIYDRLYLGGSNNLRGFRYRDVGPKDSEGEPIGGKVLARATVEYTFPIIEKIRGALFYDVGVVEGRGANDGGKKGKKAKESGGVNSDVGLGLRLDLPIGPVRIDYGIPLQSDEWNGSGGKFNFNIGYQF